MVNIFISHSSKDKEFVRRLKRDLEELGHEIWLDEGEIGTGDSISKEIEEGISKMDFLILVLTPDSISSKWVELEWRAALLREIDENKKIILPIYLKSCNVPLLLKERLYADFSKGYDTGLVKLMKNIHNPNSEDVTGTEDLSMDRKQSEELSEILTELQDKSIPLSKSLTKALSFARKYGHENVEIFCENELKGWNRVPENKPKYREIEVYFSVVPINNQSVLWGNSSSNMFLYMENTSEFGKMDYFLGNPISMLEKRETPDLKKGFLSWQRQVTHPDTGETTVYFYARPDAYQNVVEVIRAELTKRLVDL